MSEFLPTIPQCHQCGTWHPIKKDWVYVMDFYMCSEACYEEYVEQAKNALLGYQNSLQGQGDE